MHNVLGVSVQLEPGCVPHGALLVLTPYYLVQFGV